MDKTLWIVSGGVEAVPGIKRAKEMGLRVVVSDMDAEAPGFAFADDRVMASTYDAVATAKAAVEYSRKNRPIHGVICIASDVPMTVAKVASALGLPGITADTAALASDKLAMKRRFVESGIPAPWFSPVESPAHLKEIMKERGVPLVIKPVDSRGARGVLRLGPRVDPVWAFGHSIGYSPGRRVMAEEYIEGPQISTESVLIGGRGYTPGFTDRNYELIDAFAPYMIENGGEQPSVLSEGERLRVSRMAEDAGRAIGIRTGTVKGDMVLSRSGPMVIEVAARLSGGWFSTDQIPLATGVDLVGAAIKLALGEELGEDELAPKHRRGVAIRYFFPRPGRVVDIRNFERLEGVPWVHRMGFFVKAGDIIEPVTNHTKRAGFVITKGATRAEAVERAEEAVREIVIETRPVEGVST
ncbi:MAG: ATP-grasp domain-containing protein [Deltaproteobacteria bacterium]